MPSPVDKYFKEVKDKNPTYSDSQAWATAWSIYCRHVNPGSPSCHKPTEEYLKKEAAARPLLEFYDALLIQRVASRMLLLFKTAAGMRECTEKEFLDAIAKAHWPEPRYMNSKRSMTVLYSDRGTEVAQKTQIMTRGKAQDSFMCNPDYLK
jgi:hypothetical protein